MQILCESGVGWVNLLLLMHHLTRNSFNFKLNYTHDGAYAYLHRVIIELTPPSIILLTPMLHSKLNWIPKNLHNSPSKITTHFGSHSNHSIPHHIQKPSPHTTPEIPKKHPQFRAAEIQKCILRGCSDDERDVRRYREACIPGWFFFRRRTSHPALWWCFAFSISPAHHHLNFLRPPLFSFPPHATRIRTGELATLLRCCFSCHPSKMLFVYGIIRIIARCRLFFFNIFPLTLHLCRSLSLAPSLYHSLPPSIPHPMLDSRM